jgi:selenoprotein W-related protein
LAANLLDTFRQGIKNLTLIPSGGGVFEVEVNGKLAFSKKAAGRFPDETALVKELKTKFPAAA